MVGSGFTRSDWYFCQPRLEIQAPKYTPYWFGDHQQPRYSRMMISMMKQTRRFWGDQLCLVKCWLSSYGCNAFPGSLADEGESNCKMQAPSPNKDLRMMAKKHSLGPKPFEDHLPHAIPSLKSTFRGKLHMDFS